MASESYTGLKLFGCSVISANAQFGLNQNSSVATVKILEDTSVGDLLTLTNNSIRSPITVQLGSLRIRGILQSIDSQDIDISGQDIFTLKITDTKTVLSSVQIFLRALSNTNYGTNILSVVPTLSEHFEEGMSFDFIRTTLSGRTFKYGNELYRLDLSRITLPTRVVDGITVPYLITETSMTLIDFINQVMIDNGFDWYVETSDSNIITVVPIDRKVKGINIDILKVGANVISQFTGTENSDLTNRTVLIGGERQVLIEVEGNNIHPFWGLDPNTGNILSGPFIPRAELKKAINMSDHREDEDLDRSLQYANEFWGRKFYFNSAPADRDSNGNPLFDVTNAGFWESAGKPGGADPEKFGNDDGRWSAFVKLPIKLGISPDGKGLRWHESVMHNSNATIIGTTVYMQCSIERVGSSVVITLPIPLTLETITNSNGAESVVFDRAESLSIGWFPILYKKRHYGPWSFSPSTAGGKTDLIVDSSLVPWNFANRGMSFIDAVKNMNLIANARLKAATSSTLIFDTIDLKVTGLPRINIGGIIGNGTNITSIHVNFSTAEVTTQYKANLYTGDLTRYNKIYQDLSQELKRRLRVVEKPEPILPEPKITTLDPPKKDELTITFPARVIRRTGAGFFNRPYYDVIRVIQLPDGTYQDATISVKSSVFNSAETVFNIGRVLPNTIVTVQLGTFRDPQTEEVFGIFFFNSPAAPPITSRATILERTGTRRYSIELEEDDPRLIDTELTRLFTVFNDGEPANSPGRLPPGTEVNIEWLVQTDGTLMPFMNVPAHIFGVPGEGS